MKRHSKKRQAALTVLALGILSVFSLAVLATSVNDNNVAVNPVEITYKAKSPLGALAGYVLPASCESGSWNANNGYHLDGVTSDPGSCVVAPKVVLENGQCGSASGLETPSAPSTNLCTAGAASSVTGSGPWVWTCDGVNGGTNDSCSAPKENVRNDPPTTPVISGDLWAIVNQTTSNWIVSTDPENDNIFYELDWDCNGSIDGTTESRASGQDTPIGHTYTSIGTKNVCGYAVQTNDTSKRSPQGRYTIRVTADTTCTAPANACGVTSGTVMNGQCVAADLPAGYGNSCAGQANVCGMTNGDGTIGCNGQCNGATRPSNTLCSCTSPQNTCGMTNSGNLNAAGNACDAVTPADSLCPAPGAGVTINSFSASPKLVAQGKLSKLYWDITGNRNGCRISYTTNNSNAVVPVVNSISSATGQMDTTPVTEKRYYKLSCGAVEATAVISVFSLTEI